jgi:galactose mutarotase-like enzyme
MAVREDVLTDAESEFWLKDFHISAADNLKLEGSVDWSITKRTLHGGPSANIDVITMDNGVLSVQVLPTRGMGLWKGTFGGKNLGWQSPVRFPVHPSLVNLADQRDTGWLTGFNELMCRCGLHSFGAPSATYSEDGTVIERPTTLHGRVANLPAHFVSTKVDTAGKGKLSVRGIVEEAALFGGCLRLDSTLHMTAGSNSLEINDTITNCSDMSAEGQILYHINFGPPLLGEGAKIFAAIEQLAPYDEHSAKSSESWDICGKPTAGFVQQCYFVKPIADSEGLATILFCNSTGDFAVQIMFNTQWLPCLTLWKNFAGERDGYVLGIEPGTSYPNAKPLERQLGRVPQLGPGESLQASVQLSFFNDSDSIATIITSIAHLQTQCEPKIHKTLQPGFSFL